MKVKSRVTPFISLESEAEEAAKSYVSIVPENIGAKISGPDAEKSARVMDALLKMTKLDMAELQRAFDGL